MRARLHRRRRRAAPRPGRPGGGAGGAQLRARGLRDRAARQGARAADGVQPLLGHRVGARHGTRRIVRSVLLVGGVVAGRLRALSRVARAKRRTLVDRVGRTAAAPRSGRARLGARGTTDRNPVLPVSAVAGRRPVAGCARGARRQSHCSATSPSWSAPTAPTSGRASTCSASTRPSACRPTPSAPPARTGACPSTAGT